MKWSDRYPQETAPIEPRCPFPICGDDGTVEQCLANGHCGCDEKAPDYRKVTSILQTGEPS